MWCERQKFAVRHPLVWEQLSFCWCWREVRIQIDCLLVPFALRHS